MGDMSYYMGGLLFILGIAIGIRLVGIIAKIREKKELKRISIIFDDILKDRINLRFIKRINNYVYLIYKEYSLIYQIDKRDVHIYMNEDCIAITTQLTKDKSEVFINTMINQFFNQINKELVMFQGNILSQHLVIQTQDETIDDDEDFMHDDNTNELSIDNILDKINKYGIDSLTQEEKNYLDNSNKK